MNIILFLIAVMTKIRTECRPKKFRLPLSHAANITNVTCHTKEAKRGASHPFLFVDTQQLRL